MSSEVHHPIPPEYETALAVTTPMTLIDIAVQKGASVEQLSQLLDLQMRWEANEAKKAYQKAMAAFKAEVPGIIKNRTASFAGKSGGTVQYDYATLDNVCDKLIPALSKHGLTHKWRTSQEGPKIRVTCVLSHGIHSEDGATLEASPDDTGGKNAIQAIGSTKSYLERYTFLSACGVAVRGQDTDANPQWEKLGEYLDAIATAPNLNVLESTFKAGFREAMALNPPDTDASRLIAIAKDNRKAELAKDEPA
jgi:ERF superfamily